MAEGRKEKEAEGQQEMSFLDHLEELRWRLIRSVSAVLLFAILAFIFKDLIFDGILLQPREDSFITFRGFCYMSHLMGMGDRLCVKAPAFELINIDMSGQFTSHILVSILSGFVIAFPYIFVEFWYFLKPGLARKERKMARGMVFFASTLFLLGIAFGYFVISPLSVRFLGSYQVSSVVENQIRLSSYISTVAMVTVAAGILFQLPVVVYTLAKLGLMTPEFLRKYRRHSLVVVLILSAIITPPDITSQVLVAFPLLLLYEVSIMIAKRVGPKPI